MSSKTIAIIGGGAAGMMTAAAIIEGEQGSKKRSSIHLFEKNNRLGAKVIISGGGRCNVTTGTYKRKELLKQYTRGASFLEYAFREFGPRKVRRWFEEHGVPLKQEDDGRIFPVSNNGKDIVGVFEKLFTKHNVSIHFKETAQKIERKETQFLVTTSQGSYQFDIVVFATGGEAYSHTGSTGDGYTFARSLGHTITDLGPSLNSFMTKEKRIHDCSGISFPNARFESEKVTVPGSGPILLTHFGISGPHTFVLASHSAFEKVSPENHFDVTLIFDANKRYDFWNTLLIDASLQSPKKSILNILAEHFPKRFVQSLLEEYGIDKYLTMSGLSKVQRKKLTHILGNGVSLHLTNRRPGDEFVTAGGVVTKQVEEKTMESKVCPGIYFVGEILNIDGVTGGYNLQGSRATGKLAGAAICRQ